MNIDALAFAFLILVLSIFVYKKRHEIEVVRVLPPIMFFYMYRTKVGIDLMDVLAKRYNNVLKRISKLIVPIGFIGMAFVSVEMVRNLVMSLLHPQAISGAALVLPIQAKGVFYVPFFYWIISILVVVVVHEFCHGLFSRVAKVPVLSSGFAFLSILLPIVPAAFVEPNEKLLLRRSVREQLAVFAAGPVSNLVFGLLFMLVSLLLTHYIVSPMYLYDGTEVSSLQSGYAVYDSGIKPGEIILAIAGVPIKKVDDFKTAMDGKKPGDRVDVQTNKSVYNLELGANPTDAAKPYLGVIIMQKKSMINPSMIKDIVVWFDGLLFWIFVLSLGVGFFNLLPLGIVDGGRMFLSAANLVFSKDRATKIYHVTSACFLLVIVGSLVLNWVR